MITRRGTSSPASGGSLRWEQPVPPHGRRKFRLSQGMEQCRSHEAAPGHPPRVIRLLHWCGARRSDVPGGRSGTRIRRTCHVRAGRAQRVATHPLGQTLIVTSGLGWAQVEGGPIEEIRPGDVVWFPPGLKHWHGAAPATAMTHIAITEFQNGKNVDWLEKGQR